ncbi:TrbI/VirB10 family protein [Azospirillum sp. sgz302134]
MQLKEFWNRLHPTVKRSIAVAGAASVGLGVIWMGNSSMDKPEQKRDSSQIIKSVLTDRDPRDVGVDAMAAQLEIQRRKSDELERTIGSLRREIELSKKNAPPDSEGVKRLQATVQEMQRQFSDLQQQRDRERLAKVGGGTPVIGKPPGGEGDAPGATTPPGLPVEGGAELPPTAAPPEPPEPRAPDLTRPPSAADIFRGVRSPAPVGQGGASRSPTAPLANPPAAGTPAPSPAAGSTATFTPQAGGKVKIARYSQEVAAPREADKEGDADNVLATGDSVPIPAGSILSGTLITGMDAPTGQSARKDPFPALLRLKMEAILPNRFMLDVKDCFVLMGGFGDLSSERAYLRAETISCVRNDGRIVETRLEAYATGGDGKSGVRGRLVSKQGQLIGRALMAGFMEGVSKAFDVKPVPVIQTPTSSGSLARKQQYQSNFSEDSFQSAAVAGASSALDRIAQFYIDLAEATQPVVEVDAGRAIDMVVTRGTKLDFSRKGSSMPTSGSAVERGAGKPGAGAGALFPDLPTAPTTPAVPTTPVHKSPGRLNNTPSSRSHTSYTG